MTVRGNADVGTALVVVSALAVYAASDDALVDAVAYLGVLVLAAAAACVAAARAPLAHRTMAWLVAAGVSLTVLGDVLWEVLDSVGIANDVSVADPAWIASYVALCSALVLVLRRSRAVGDWAFVLDAATIVVVSLLLLGSSVVGTIAADDSHPVMVRFMWSAYPVADAVLLALLVRALTNRTARTWLGVGFTVGVCLWLAADLAYLYGVAGGVRELAMDAAWMLAPVLMARSLWQLPSSPPADPPAPRSEHRMGQLVLAIAPLVVPAAIEVATDLVGRRDRPLLLAVGTVTLTAIAFLRMAALVRAEDRALAEAERARDAALVASAAKSQFLATVSHEVRTPLTVVLAASELLHDEVLDPGQADLVRRLHRSGAVLTRLVDELLDFSRLDAGDLRVDRRVFDLVEAVEGVAVPARARIGSAGPTLRCAIDPGASTEAVGDPARVAQVVDILLDNAIKFTEAGEVRLDVRRADDDADVVEVTVADTGCGIAQEHLETVFESFHQVDTSQLVPYSGIGLGLTICRELVTLMDGTLTVSSAPGEGSTFVARVRVPAWAGERLPVAAR